MTEYEKIAMQFSNEYCLSYQGKVVENDVTQKMWYAMHLEKRRLVDLGVHKTVNIKYPVYKIEKRILKDSTETIESEGEKVTIINKPAEIQQEYIGGYNKRRKFTDNKAFTQCLIEEKEDSQSVCPYCGGIQTTKQLSIGCKFCNLCFVSKNQGKKVGSFVVFHDYRNEFIEKESKYKKAALISAVIAMILFLIYTLSVKKINLNSLEEFRKIYYEILLFCSTGVFVALFSAYLFSKNKLKKKNSSRIVYNNTLVDVRRIIEDFNVEVFFSKLDQILKILHFARTQNELNGYFDMDCSSYLAVYNDVVDCNIKSYCLTKHKSIENSHLLYVEVFLDLVCYENKRFVKRHEKMNLAISHDEFCVKGIRNEWVEILSTIF